MLGAGRNANHVLYNRGLIELAFQNQSVLRITTQLALVFTFTPVSLSMSST
jgi:hypothetical protein